MGARESNAGDDFHFWWAAYRALALVAPGTDLRLLTLEGLASVDDPDEAYETVDVAEYFGGNDAATARALVLSQLKYSTRQPEAGGQLPGCVEQRGDDQLTEPQGGPVLSSPPILPQRIADSSTTMARPRPPR